MRKPIPLKMIKILILSFLGALVLSFIIFNITMNLKAKRKIKDKIKESPITELAPYSILSPPSWLRQTTPNGTIYQYDPSSNDFIIEIDGKKYHIIDGQVYREDENSLHLVDDDREKAFANKGLLDVALFGDGETKALAPDIRDLVKDIPPLSLSDSEIEALLNKINALLGTNLTYDDYVKGVRDGKTLEQILFGNESDNAWLDNFLKDSGISKEDFDAFLKANGLSLEDFRKLLDANGIKTYADFLNAKNEAFPNYDTTSESSPSLSDRAMNSNDVIKKVVPNPPENNTNLFASLKEDDKNDMNGLRPITLSNNNVGNSDSMTAALKNLSLNNEYATQNNQDGKKNFVDAFKKSDAKGEWLTPFQVASGTVIPLVMINGINSDLPGDIIAESSSNIYDTATGKNILIPKGTKFIGTYDSSISFGQNRVIVVWTELLRPDGYTSTLPGWSGTDKMGFSGLSGSTDNHIASIIGASALSSLIDVGVNVANGYINNDTLKDVASALTNSATSTSQKYLDKTINMQPTIVVAPGTHTTLFVNKTITLEPLDYSNSQNHKFTNSQNLWNSQAWRSL